jgi:hypothetical protein
MSIPVHYITRLYAALVHLYPRQFRREFGEEMQSVFAEAITDAAQGGFLLLAACCLRELWDWPRSLLLAYLQAIRHQARDVLLQPHDSDTPGLLPAHKGGMIPLVRAITGRNRTVRRACDLTIVLVSLVFSAPFLLVIALFIKLDSPGPVIFCQQRMGRNGRLFTLYKFRSMTWQHIERRSSPCHRDGVAHSRQTCSVTRAGRLLRRLNLDELPQLFNVIKGDISILGPRPKLPE